jgi:hypothetical protein
MLLFYHLASGFLFFLSAVIAINDEEEGTGISARSPIVKTSAAVLNIITTFTSIPSMCTVQSLTLDAPGNACIDAIPS